MTKIKDPNTGRFVTDHGKRFTKEYTTWQGMRNRCGNKFDKAYRIYGGRGIKVCERWQHSFLLFLQDMGLAPSKKHSIDRIEVNGNYEPSNCRWATCEQQNNNKTDNLFLTFQGQTKTFSQWSRQFNIKLPTLYNRLKRGWSVEDCLTKPVDYRHGIKRTQIDWMGLLDKWLTMHNIQKQYPAATQSNFIHDRVLVIQ